MEATFSSLSSSSLSSVIRVIYEGDEYEDFMKKLEEQIRNYDKDIERMCNAHYQGFVDGIHELLQVRPQASRLKHDIYATNAELVRSAEAVQKKAEELIKNRRILCSAESAIEHLTACLPVLEMYAKLESQMKEEKYYPALKTLEQLEQSHLPRVSKYRFAQAMCVKIPQIREQIKAASMSDLKDFLENVRKLSGKIGELAMKNTSRQQNLDDEYIEVIFGPNANRKNSGSGVNSVTSSPRKKSLPTASKPFITVTSVNANGSNTITNSGNVQVTSTKTGATKKRRAPQPPISSSNPSIGSGDDLDSPVSPPSTNSAATPSSEDEISATDLVDFSPVYRCLHIFSCLGSRDQFETYYRQQRQQQAKLALDSPPDMHESIDGFRSYFCEIIGFFVIEDHVMSTASGLVTKEYLDKQWENTLTSVLKSLRHNSAICDDEELMLRIKRSIILLSYTIRSHGFNVDPLIKLLIDVRDRYNEILMNRWWNVFKNILDADNYHPMQVNSLEEYNQVLNEFPYVELECPSVDEKMQFPRKFPFSSFVPKVYSQVKQFILACIQFSQDINSSHREVEEMVRKSTNTLLTRTLGSCLSEQIKKPDLGLLKLIQISINTNYLEEACVQLEEFILKSIECRTVAGTLSSPSTPMSTLSMTRKESGFSKFTGQSIFKNVRSDAESQIYIELNHKIDEILEDSHYDWILAEPIGTASPYITVLIKFLKDTFEAFSNLPTKVAQTACHSACKHISSALMNFLMSEEPKAITMGALEQFNLDLIQCELFASSDPVKGFDEGFLQLCFSDLRQLMDLFLTGDWTTYLSDMSREETRNHSKYYRVKPQTALNLFEKLAEADRKKNLFTSLKKNERDKKKLNDTVAKQLKQLVVNDNSSSVKSS